MKSHLQALLSGLERGPAMLVTVVEAQGSVPREVGAWMAVWPDGQANTIGGGHLEWQALAEARRSLGQGTPLVPLRRRYALGPSLGQCCGGVVHLQYERVSSADVPALATRLAPQGPTVAVFGAGHVGLALVQLLSTLPFHVRWVDSRDSVFPTDVPTSVCCEHSDPVQAAVTDLPPGSRVLIMSFSHAEDLEVVAACLQRQRSQGDLAWVGLIGSRSKWATFCSRLRQRGYSPEELGQIVCPIGLPAIQGKAPEVIAVSVAAQLLALQ